MCGYVNLIFLGGSYNIVHYQEVLYRSSRESQAKNNSPHFVLIPCV